MTDPSSTFATLRVAAGALFLDGASRVLLVHPTYKDTWDIPGGYVERGESPAAACRREISEELGLDRRPQRLITVDWAPHEREGDKMLFLFDCGDLGADEERIRLDGDELDRAGSGSSSTNSTATSSLVSPAASAPPSAMGHPRAISNTASYSLGLPLGPDGGAVSTVRGIERRIKQ